MIIVNSIINNNTVAILPACISNVKFNLILLVKNLCFFLFAIKSPKTSLANQTFATYSFWTSVKNHKDHINIKELEAWVVVIIVVINNMGCPVSLYTHVTNPVLCTVFMI